MSSYGEDTVILAQVWLKAMKDVERLQEQFFRDWYHRLKGEDVLVDKKEILSELLKEEKKQAKMRLIQVKHRFLDMCFREEEQVEMDRMTSVSFSFSSPTSNKQPLQPAENFTRASSLDNVFNTERAENREVPDGFSKADTICSSVSHIHAGAGAMPFLPQQGVDLGIFVNGGPPPLFRQMAKSTKESLDNSSPSLDPRASSAFDFARDRQSTDLLPTLAQQWQCNLPSLDNIFANLDDNESVCTEDKARVGLEFIMKKRPESHDYFCQICRVQLTGEAPVLSHAAGEKHRRKYLRMKENGDDDRRRNLFLNRHFLGANGASRSTAEHLESTTDMTASSETVVDVQQIEMEMQSTQAAAEGLGQPFNFAEYEKLSERVVGMKKREDDEDEWSDYYDEDSVIVGHEYLEKGAGNNYTCTLCNVKLSGEKQAQTHLSGKAHHKKYKNEKEYQKKQREKIRRQNSS